MLGPITDAQARQARLFKQRGRISWRTIAKYLDVPEYELIRRCDRVLARKMKMTAPGWLYGYKSPRKQRRLISLTNGKDDERS